MATIEKRGKSYRITASCGYDVNGTQERPRMTWKPEPGMTERQIEKEVNRQAVLFEEDCKNGFTVKSLKFQDFAENQYFVDFSPEKLRIKTVEGYSHMKQRVYDAIGHLRMNKITPRHIQKLASAIINGDEKHKKLSAKYAKNHLAFASSVFNYGIQMKVVKENPCHAVKIAVEQQEEHDCYTIEEAQHFLDLLASEALFYQAFFILAIYGGYRRGELCGIEWKDIDFDTGVLSIRRASYYTKEKGIFSDKPKTRKSQRSLKLPAEVIEVLRKYKIEQAEHRLKCGDRWIDTDRLFTAWNGKPINPNTPYSWLDRFCKRTGMRRAQFAIHSFRHLNASLLITSGVDVKTVSSALGHSQVSTTMNIYAHTFEKVQAEAAEAIATALPLKSHG